MNALGTLLAVFGILVVGGASYELYNKTKSHHRTKHHRHKHHVLSRSHSKSKSKSRSRSHSKSGNDFFGLFKKSRKSKKISPRTTRKLFNIFKNTLQDKSVSKKLKSKHHIKHTPSMTSSEKRQYYLNKFKHNVHKTKKRRRRIYI
jgi:hypothetical protein